jgi:hypothetical protein
VRAYWFGRPPLVCSWYNTCIQCKDSGICRKFDASTIGTVLEHGASCIIVKCCLRDNQWQRESGSEACPNSLIVTIGVHHMMGLSCLVNKIIRGLRSLLGLELLPHITRQLQTSTITDTVVGTRACSACSHSQR